MKNIFLKLFFAEVVVIAVAITAFRFIAERILAGVIAGTFFSALGFWIFLLGLKDPGVRRTPTFWLGCVHLFAVALPMMVTRLLNHSQEFRDILIWGMPGPDFHKLSTAVYLLLLLATLFDLIRFAWRERKTAR